MMKKLFTIGLMIFTLSASAQLYTGGNFTVNYVNGVYGDIAPVIGYKLGKLNVGTSPFISFAKPTGGSLAYSFGDRIFTQYDIYKGVFAHAEIEAANVGVTGLDGSPGRTWALALPIGGGLQQRVGKITVQGMILYDVLMDSNSPNENPIIRGGVNYSF